MSDVIDEAQIKRLFMLLHGMYGNQVLDKFRIGQADDKGEDIGMAAERLHRPVDDRLAADRTVLLRSSRAGTKPTPGGDKDGCCTLRFRHLTQLRAERGCGEGFGPCGAQPLPCRMRKNRAFPNSCGKSSFCCSALAQMIELSKV